MRDYKSSNTFADMCATADMFRHFGKKHGPQLDELAGVYSNRRFVVIGAGSSLEFPGMNAFQLFPDLTTYPVQANEVPLELDKEVVRFLVSNSGRTTEVLMHADADCENPTIILTSPKGFYGDDGRHLIDIYNEKGKPKNWHVIELTTPPEMVNAATGSVMEEAAIIQSIYGLDSPFTLVIPETIAEIVKATLNYGIGEHARSSIRDGFEGYEHGESKLYITGPDSSCVAREAIIKAYEIIGGNVVPSYSLSMLHGQESTIKGGDALFVTFPSEWPFGDFDIKSLRERVEGRGGRMIYVDRGKIYRSSIVPDPLHSIATAEKGYLHLAMVWKALLEIGAHLGIDPDKNKGTLKVGNEEKGKRESKLMEYAGG